MPATCASPHGARCRNDNPVTTRSQAMKRLLIVAMMAGTLAACGSSPTKEQDGAAVEDRKPGEVVDRPPVKPSTTTPLTDKPFAGGPLKDPNNILSKRSIYFDYDSNLVRDEFKPIVTAHAR